MKRFRLMLVALMIVAMTFGMAACGESEPEEEKVDVAQLTESKDLFHINDKYSKSMVFVTKDQDEVTLTLDKVVADADDVEFSYKWMNEDGEVLDDVEDIYVYTIDKKNYNAKISCEITATNSEYKQVETEVFKLHTVEFVDLESYITSGANMSGPAAYGISTDDVECFASNFALEDPGKYKLTYTKVNKDDKIVQMSDGGQAMEPVGKKDGDKVYELEEGVNYAIVVNGQGVRGVKLTKVK